MRGIAFPIWSRASAGGAPAPRRPAARPSLAVELDDELLGDRDLDVVAQRQASDDALLLVRIELQPLGYLPTAGVDVIVDSRLQFRRRPQLDRVSHLHEERRHRHLAAVHLEVAVRHHLPPLAARGREPEPVHDVVQAKLEEPQQVFAGHALLGLRPLEVLAELALEHAVDPLGLLLLAQLHAERGQLAAVQAVLARRIVTPLDRALVGEAAGTFQEELHPFASAQPALRVAIPRHGRPYTRRRFGGRQPSCGIGVTSRIAVISRPAACSERMAASRPAPGPRTKTSICFKPYSIALRAASSEAVWAAKGVLLREPLNPALPALDQDTTFPMRSVSVTIVLLNVAWMWAMPVRTSRRSRFLPPFFRGVGFASSAMPYAPAFFGAAAGAAAGAGAAVVAATFFLIITPRFGPFRVRAFVCVR